MAEEVLGRTWVIHKVYPILCDNQSMIYLAKNNIFHACMKRIDVQHQWICDIMNSREVELLDVRTEKNLFGHADKGDYQASVGDVLAIGWPDIYAIGEGADWVVS